MFLGRLSDVNARAGCERDCVTIVEPGNDERLRVGPCWNAEVEKAEEPYACVGAPVGSRVNPLLVDTVTARLCSSRGIAWILVGRACRARDKCGRSVGRSVER